MARILIVDDEPAVVGLVRDLLASQDYAADGAANGAQALEKLKASSYDLLIIDLNMPVMGGIEAIKVIRRDPALARLKILVFTADAKPDVRDGALAAGADGCLQKPIKLDEFSATIRQALSGA